MPKKSNDEIVVRVQRMFPNCQKYKKCCSDGGYEKMMMKADIEEINKNIHKILSENINKQIAK